MAGARLVRDHRRDATIDLVAGYEFEALRPPPVPPVATGAAGSRERRGRVLTRRAQVSTGAQDSLGSVATPTAG